MTIGFRHPWEPREDPRGFFRVKFYDTAVHPDGVIELHPRIVRVTLRERLRLLAVSLKGFPF